MGGCINWGVKKNTLEFPNYTLKVVTKTSGQTDLGIFDFHYNNDPQFEDKILSRETIIKRNWFLHALNSKTNDKITIKGDRQLQTRFISFVFTKGNYFIFNGNDPSENFKWEEIKNQLWLVINKVANNKQSMHLTGGKYKLRSGDLVKFGGVVFKVTIPSFERDKQTKRYKKGEPNSKAHFKVSPENGTKQLKFI